MGRHSDPDRGSFYRSLAGTAARALGALVVVAVLVAGVVLFTGDRGGTPAVVFPTDPPATLRAEPEPEPAPTATPTPTPTPTAVVTPASPTPEATRPPPPTEELTVQVLDAGAGAEAAEELAEQLDDVGYVVEAVNPVRCCEARSIVLYTAGHERAAEALVERDPRFVEARRNDRFSEAVALHLLLGRDWER